MQRSTELGEIIKPQGIGTIILDLEYDTGNSQSKFKNVYY